MKGTLICLVIFTCLVWCDNVFAENVRSIGSDSESSGRDSEVESPRRAVLEHNGRSGFWFRRDVALEMLSDLREYPLRVQEVALLESALRLRTEQETRLREMVLLERETAVQATNALEIAERRVSEAESDRDVWWRRPILWVVVGIIATVVVEVIVLEIWKSLTD
jgi:hypothetical protein